MPAIEIKLIVVLDTTVAEGVRFDFDSGLLEELQDEAAGGSLKIALSEVQVGEMRAHVKEQADGLRSVMKALQAGAGKKRIASNTAKENEGVAIPRLFDHPDVRGALDSIVAVGSNIVTAFELFLAKPYVVTIPCGHVPASKLLPAYFAGHPPFGPGRKKDEFPDAIAIEAICDFAREQGRDVEVHIVTSDDDWHQAFPGHSETLTIHRSVADVLKYLRSLDDAAGQIEDSLLEDAGVLGSAIAGEFPGLGFVLDDDWDASFSSIKVSAVDFKEATLVSLNNRRATIEFLAEITFSVEVDYTNYGTSAWDSEDGDYIYKDIQTARIVHRTDAKGTAVVTIQPETGKVAGVEKLSWDKTVFELALGTADDIEEVFYPDPDDEPDHPDHEEPADSTQHRDPP